MPKSDRLTEKRIALLEKLSYGELPRHRVAPYYPTLYWLVDAKLVGYEKAADYNDDIFRITDAGRATLSKC